MRPFRRAGPETLVAGALAVLPLILLGPAWARGLSAYWSDLTYLHLAWRAGPAMLVQAGRAPLWEPSLYFGMPMAASMQGGVFHPSGMLFHLFGFATAVALFQALHLVLGSWLCALWLRSWGARPGAALAGGVLFGLGGVLVSRLAYLNHLAVLAWAPALPLFFRRPRELSCVLAFMVLAGYPTFIPGLALAAWGCALAARADADWRGAARDWMIAAAAAGALAAVQLLPGFELAAHSRRSSGIGLEEALTWSFAPRDFLQWIGPAVLRSGEFDPASRWLSCVYLGVAGAAAVLLGAARAPRPRAAVLACLLAMTAALMLGGSTEPTRAVWEAVPALRFVRYPGNLSYLALLPLCLLASAAWRGRLGAVLALAAIVELPVLGRLATPMTERGIFTDQGPLARALQERQEGLRYLMSPRALHASGGDGVLDWRRRLYGLTNAVARTRAAANFGEPLVPAASYAVMDFMHSRPDADSAAAWMPWLGASRLLTPVPAASRALESEGRVIWEIARLKETPSLAYAFGPAEGAALPESWPAAPPRLGRPVALSRSREDRFSASGEGAGWLYAAEPLYPGWRTTILASGSESSARVLPALGAFQKVETPPGPWTVRWRYDPPSWRWGVLLTTVALLALAGSWYHRLGARHA